MPDEYTRLIDYYRSHPEERASMLNEVSAQCFPAARYIDALEVRVRELESQLALYEKHAPNPLHVQLAAEFPDVNIEPMPGGRFCIVLPGLSQDEAEQRARQISERARELLNRPMNKKLQIERKR